ncbi:lipoprotein [Erwinia sp. S43]|uniref:LPS translocon maturation chaperone LptM n=1 Tax=Erwiniaceae TaxID=1903409 RepID=UPI00190CEFC0|nr:MULTISPECIES: lipoprotein [Erwiniaceae]MBK0004093.1 lipoprotein [Erwinia sp. S38]MBK0034736.1 lipoprotein [Erwinia sp. S43]MBM7345989.1 putative small lipoprotein YifL [Pantoea coffeiphila]MCW1877491.1 lipoprotein [Erwinia sp. INIA01]
MKKAICQLAMLLAVVSLAGCGLKGPLYFPADETSKPQATQTSSPTQSGSSVSSPATTSGQDVKPVQ